MPTFKPSSHFLSICLLRIPSAATLIQASNYIPRNTFPALEEKIVRYFDNVKRVPSSSCLVIILS